MREDDEEGMEEEHEHSIKQALDELNKHERKIVRVRDHQYSKADMTYLAAKVVQQQSIVGLRRMTVSNL